MIIFFSFFFSPPASHPFHNLHLHFASYAVTLDISFRRWTTFLRHHVACLEFLSQPNSGVSDSSTVTENVSDAGLYSMQHQSCNENNKVPTEIACHCCVEHDRSSVPLAVGWGRFNTVAYKRLVLSTKPKCQQVFGLFQAIDLTSVYSPA